MTIFNFESTSKLSLVDLWMKYDEYVKTGIGLSKMGNEHGYILCMAAAQYYLDIYFERVEEVLKVGPISE